MNRLLLTASIAIFSQLAFAQENPISPFTNLKVFDNINVKLVSSSYYKSEIEGDNINDVEFLSAGNELKVRMKTAKVLQGKQTNITLYYKNINSIQASQGAKVSSDKKVKATKLNLISNEGSSIDLTIDVDVLEAKANTGGYIKLSGDADSQTTIVSTGGEFSAQNLKTDISNITVNAGGKAVIYAKKSADARVRAGGTIDIYGNPKVRNDKKFIGGKINYKD